MKYIILWVPSLAYLLEYVQPFLKDSNTLKVLGVITTIGVTFALYQIKKRIIIIFGLIEIVGGGWTIWATFTQNFASTILYALTFAGGIFLIVNGFENIRKYKVQSQND